MKINTLIVEDDFFIASDIERLLRKLQLEVKIAYNYQEAVDILESFKPDIVVSDINLQESKTGVDVVNYIKEKENPKIIFLTSCMDSKSMQNASKTDMFMYLVKPFSEDQFLVTLSLAKEEVIKRKEVLKRLKIDSLTKKEIKIVKLISEGKTSKEIANFLNVSHKTIENKRSNILLKIDIPTDKNSLLQWVLKNKTDIINL